MSVAAARWVADFLKAQEPPHKGGPSRALRSVLSTLARDAAAYTHIAVTSASTIAAEWGYHPGHVRRMFDQLEAHGFHRVPRPGCSDEWHLDPAEMSTTPRIWCAGLTAPTPRISKRDPAHFEARPRASDARRREEGFAEGRPAPLRLAAAPPPPGDRRRVAEILAAAAEYSMRPAMFGTRWRETLDNPPTEHEAEKEAL